MIFFAINNHGESGLGRYHPNILVPLGLYPRHLGAGGGAFSDTLIGLWAFYLVYGFGFGRKEIPGYEASACMQTPEEVR